MHTDEKLKQHQLHPSFDRETKVAVFNKFLKDIENKALPDDFNAEQGSIVIGLNDYEALLSDGEENLYKLNRQGEFELFYQLPDSGLKGFKSEVLSKEELWEYEDVFYLCGKELITKAKHHEVLKKLSPGFKEFMDEWEEKRNSNVTDYHEQEIDDFVELYELELTDLTQSINKNNEEMEL